MTLNLTTDDAVPMDAASSTTGETDDRVPASLVVASLSACDLAALSAVAEAGLPVPDAERAELARESDLPAACYRDDVLALATLAFHGYFLPKPVPRRLPAVGALAPPGAITGGDHQ